jgi:hypothetical protein
MHRSLNATVLKKLATKGSQRRRYISDADLSRPATGVKTLNIQISPFLRVLPVRASTIDMTN